MRDVLYYAIKSAYYQNDNVVAVTSEKRSRYFGRDAIDNSTTHGMLRDLTGRFDTVEAATAFVSNLNVIRAKHSPIIKAAGAALSKAHKAEREEIAKACQNVQ